MCSVWQPLAYGWYVKGTVPELYSIVYVPTVINVETVWVADIE